MKKRSKTNQFIKSKKILFISLPIILLILLTLLSFYLSTGFLQSKDIDKTDLQRWNYSQSGIILGGEGFSIPGNNETCWLLIHSYTATPAEMKELAQGISKVFNDTIVAPRLSGHSETPSKLMNKNLTSWYPEVEAIFLQLNSTCKKVNVLGSSFGSALSLRLAEEHDLNNVYLLNTFLHLTSRWYSPLPREFYVKAFSNLLHYNKKKELARINDPEGLSTHIAYWAMPYPPVKNSFPFIKETLSKIPKLTEPVFIAHSRNDKVAHPKNADLIFDNSNSMDKELNWYDKSNHVLLKDYQRKELILAMIKFEDSHRNA